MPDFRDYAVEVPKPAVRRPSDLRGRHLRPRRDGKNVDNFRMFGPDETASNRFQAIFEVTGKPGCRSDPEDAETTFSPSTAGDGGPSEHQCEAGWRATS